jgi:hypothetical protein
MSSLRLRIVVPTVAIPFLTALLLASGPALAQGNPPPVSEAPGSPILLMIHGRDQPVGEQAAVEKAWQEAIDSGLARAGAPDLIPRGSRRFYWYADILDSGSGCSYLRVDSDESDLRGRAKGVDVWPKVRDLLLAIARQMPNAAERALVNLKIRDTERYLSNESIACGVDSGLEGALEEGLQERQIGQSQSIPTGTPVIVVAHSMGSMILYKNLMGPLKHLSRPVYVITIGSMLGERAVQRTLLGSHAAYPAPVPLPVTWWRNVLNRGDLFAFASNGAFFSQHPSKRPKDIRINTGNQNRHSATGYLSSREVGDVLRESWCLALDQPSCRPRELEARKP